MVERESYTDHCMLERMQGKLIEEVEWKPLYGGAQGEGKFK